MSGGREGAHGSRQEPDRLTDADFDRDAILAVHAAADSLANIIEDVLARLNDSNLWVGNQPAERVRNIQNEVIAPLQTIVGELADAVAGAVSGAWARRDPKREARAQDWARWAEAAGGLLTAVAMRRADPPTEADLADLDDVAADLAARRADLAAHLWADAEDAGGGVTGDADVVVPGVPDPPAGIRLAATPAGVAVRVRRRTPVADVARALTAAAGQWPATVATVRPVELVFAREGGPAPAGWSLDLASYLRNLGEDVFVTSYYVGDRARLAERLTLLHTMAENAARQAGVELGDPGGAYSEAALESELNQIYRRAARPAVPDLPRHPPALPNDAEVTTIHELALTLGGDSTSWTGDALRLIAKSDPVNREALRRGLPVHVRAWELWMGTAAPTVGQLNDLLDEEFNQEAPTRARPDSWEAADAPGAPGGD